MSCLTVVQGLDLCTMLVRMLILDFYAIKIIFIVGYDCFSLLCNKKANNAVQIRKIHRSRDDFICSNNE